MSEKPSDEENAEEGYFSFEGGLKPDGDESQLEIGLNENLEEVRIYRGENKSFDQLIEEEVEEVEDVNEEQINNKYGNQKELPIGLVLEPIHLNRKFNYLLLLKWILVTLLIIFLITYLFSKCSFKDNKSRESGVNKNTLNVNSYKINPLPRGLDEDLFQTDYRARDTIKKFFSVSDRFELNGIIRFSSRILNHVEDHYSRNAFSIPKLESIESVEKLDGNLSGFFIAKITVDDVFRARTVLLEDTDRGFLLDWEEFVRYGQMNWDDFVKSDGSDPFYFRVRATLDSNPEFAFPERSKWICVRISDWKSEEDLYGYVRKDSDIGVNINNLLDDEWEKECILKICFPKERKGGINQVKIVELINNNWIIK